MFIAPLIMCVALLSSTLLLTNLSYGDDHKKETKGAEKYTFDDLKEVKSINNWKLHGWTYIDSRSLIVRTSPNKRYLLVLSRENMHLDKNTAIIVTSSAGSVKTRYDSVSTKRDNGIRSSIKKIYVIESKEQADKVITRIQGKDDHQSDTKKDK